MTTLGNSSQHWLKRAEEVRTIAHGISDLEAKRAMLEIADRYERIAKLAEARAAGVTLPTHRDH